MGVMGINMDGFALSRCSWLQTGMLFVCTKDISWLIPRHGSVDRKLWVKYSVKDQWEVFCHHNQMISSAIEQRPLLQINTSGEVVLSGSFLSSLLLLVHIWVCMHTHMCVLHRHMSWYQQSSRKSCLVNSKTLYFGIYTLDVQIGRLVLSKHRYMSQRENVFS